MKSFILVCLFLSLAHCYDDVYDMKNGNAIMTMNYLLTGIVVPWVIAFVLCCISCIFCCIPKKYNPSPVAFVQVPTTTVVQQPMMMVQDPNYGQQPYGQQPYGMTQQPVYGQQVMSPGTNLGQPMYGGQEVKQ